MTHTRPAERRSALPGGEVLIRLAWGRLAFVAAPDATWETERLDPPLWRHRDCPTCGGSGHR